MRKNSILLDANILSIFTEVGRLDILFELFKKKDLYVSPAILDELQIAVERGQVHIQEIIDSIGTEKLIQITAPTGAESTPIDTYPQWMGSGEAECIAICQSRGWTFSSFDRRAINYCIRENIKYLKLNVILTSLWRSKMLTKDEVQQIVQEIEQSGRQIRDKDEIFK